MLIVTDFSNISAGRDKMAEIIEHSCVSLCGLGIYTKTFAWLRNHAKGRDIVRPDERKKMEKIINLTSYKRRYRRRKESAETSTVDVRRLTHFMMNQLTVIGACCTKLEGSLGPEWSARQHTDIETLETAAAKIATYINVLRFGLGKIRNHSDQKPFRTTPETR